MSGCPTITSAAAKPEAGQPEKEPNDSRLFLLAERAGGLAVERIDVAAFSALKTFDPPGSIDTYAYAINLSGAVTGYYNDSKHLVVLGYQDIMKVIRHSGLK